MSIIGFLGYFQIEQYSTKVFNFFNTLLGSYSIVLPITCLIFTVICWKISKVSKIDDRDFELKNHNFEQKLHVSDRIKPRTHTLHNKPPEDNGFSCYFADNLTIKDSNMIDNNDYHCLGTNFSTYFGQGEKNIYLPAKTVSMQGFRDYFRNENNTTRAFDKVANDNVIRENHLREFKIHPKKQFYTTKINETKGSITEKDLLKNITQINNMEKEELLLKNRSTIAKWQLPGLELLRTSGGTDSKIEKYDPKLLEGVLGNFGVNAKVVNICVGPVITRYELSPAPGTKISKIVNLSDDIALALASREVRIEAPIPGKAAVGIEIPRITPRTVFFREVIDSEVFNNSKGKMKVALGKDIADTAVVAELEKMPHLLVAGATGSGKSIFINCLINSLLYNVTPDEVKFLLIDPKMVELTQYNGIPHLLAPVVTDPKKANKYLKYVVTEMENRYELFAANKVRDIDHYNRTFDEGKLPYIVVIIDELADLMMVASIEIEESICRLAQMARAAGIHLVIATQRPSVNVITGLIKANIPSRISFAVSSQIDSRTILDTSGAEKLLGKGDMLYSPIGLNKPVRIHGCFIDEQEIENVIKHWEAQGEPDYNINEEQLEEYISVEKKEEEFDERLIEAGQLVITSGIASVSFLQRRLRVGYSRAARLMDMLEEARVVGGYEGSKPREILMSLEEFNQLY